MASVFKRKKDKGRHEKPWMISFTDEHGHRKTVTGCTDKAETKRVAEKLEADAFRRRYGVTTAAEDRYLTEGSRPLREHVEEYLKHCKHVGIGNRTYWQKKMHIENIVAGIKANRLSDLEPNRVEMFLQDLSTSGKSARTVNHYRSDLVAFMNWCVKTRRIPHNPLSVITKLDESMDRRRIRRALTHEELAHLLEVAAEQDKLYASCHRVRYPIYLIAAYTGLRRNEIRSLEWRDFDPEAKTLRIRKEVSKAKHEDTIPLHAQVFDILLGMHKQGEKPKNRIFTQMPTIQTFYKDLTRARAKWIDAANSQEDKKRREKSDFLKQRDSEGRVVDLHAMRTTLGTNLALEGVAPQMAQRLMRHSDYKTTLAHYTVLGLADTAKAINTLPAVSLKADEMVATGTEGRAAPGAARRAQGAGRQTMQNPAPRCNKRLVQIGIV